MENVIASPIREFSEKAGKCLLEYETLYNNSRLGMNEEDYTQFTRLLMDDSASDADDEVTDTSREELNSSTEILYKPRNVYSIADGNKPFTLIIKKQQGCNDTSDAQIIINGERTNALTLQDFEHFNNTLKTVVPEHANMQTKQNDEAQFKPPESSESTSTERKTFSLQDFNKFYDETNKMLWKLSDPVISGYEANCESEDEVGNSHQMSKPNAVNDSSASQQCDTGFQRKHSIVNQDDTGKSQPNMSDLESASPNKDEIELNCTVHCSDINDCLDKPCNQKVNGCVNDDMFSVDQYNDIEIDKNVHESDSGMESFSKNSCIIDYTNNQVSSADSMQNEAGCVAVDHLHTDELSCSEMKNDAGARVGDSNGKCSDAGNAIEDGKQQELKDNEITQTDDGGGEESDGNIGKTIENDCGKHTHRVHKSQMETTVENKLSEIATDVFHESMLEEMNEYVTCSLDVTENGDKPVQTNLHYESLEDSHMPVCQVDHTEQRAVVEQLEKEESVLDASFLNNFGNDHAVLSPQKSCENEKVKQNEVVNPGNSTLDEENNILEASDKCESEVGTSLCESEIPLSNTSPVTVQKDSASTVDPFEKSIAVSKLGTKSKDDRAPPADSFADDAMDCSYNDSSSCLDHSPLLFSSDDENYYYTEDSVALDTSKSAESETQTQQERRKLRRLQLALAGVPPPPSVTIPQLDVNEILKLIKENQKLMKFDGSSANPEEKEGSPDGKEHKRPLTPFCTEEVKNLPWPEAKSCNFYGFQYNNGKLSEELEALYERLRDRYVGCETLSSCNVWFPGISTKAIEKKMKRRSIGQSPGRRLSHLAKRRQAFSSANMLPSVAGSLPAAAARRGCNRLIMVEVKKGDHRTKGKGQPAKKAALNVNNKLQQTKRALFKSPPSGRKRVSSASKNKSSSKKIKREVDRSRVHNSKRALWPSLGKSENTIPDSNSSRHFKRQREESEDERKHKFPRRSLFGEREREKESNDSRLLHSNSSNAQVLSQQHKKKLLWAVAETLRTKGVSMNHPSFRTLASSLARKVCSSLPDMSKRREGRTSEFMLQIANEHVDNILKTVALQEDKTEQIKV